MNSLTKYPMVLREKKIYKALFLILLIGLTSVQLIAQSKATLQKKRDNLNKKIAYTRKLIDETKKNESAATTQIVLLDRQISFRNQLITTISSEISEIDAEIESTELSIDQLQTNEAALKEEYKKMLYDSYKNRNSYDKIMYIFASENFDQAYKRLKIMQQYDEVRKNQTFEMQATQEKLRISLEALELSKAEKQGLVTSKKDEYTLLKQNKDKKNKFISDLKSKKKDLDKTINNQLAEKKRISRAIRKIIEAETKKGSFSLTPAGKIVSANFEKNKGKLPWPVSRGIITEGFGKQPHKTIPGIITENNGVDIATEKESTVMSVFHGTVTSVFDIPGAGKNIIVTHGAYKTVYSNLKSVSVSKGDKIETGQRIGEILTIEGKSVLHMELWKMSSSASAPINPTYWISK